MKKLNILCIAALATMSSTYTTAQNLDRFYGGIGAGEAVSKIDYNLMSKDLMGSGITDSGTNSNHKDASYKIFGGYQFNPYYAVEVGYFNFGAFKFNTNTTSAGSLNGNLKIDGIDLAIVGTIPLSEKLSLIGRGGWIDARTSDTFSTSIPGSISNSNPQKTQNNYSAGFGFVYKINQLVTARAELERYRINDGLGNNANVNLATLSLVFPFGNTKIEAPKIQEKVSQPEIQENRFTEEKPKVIQPQKDESYIIETKENLRISFSAEILFEFDKAKITPLGKRSLDKFAKEVNAVEYDLVTIDGNSDRIGKKRYNEKLSLARAESVKEYLISIKAIQENKTKTIGSGSSKPQTDISDCRGIKTSKAVIACLQPDRRVDVDLKGSEHINK